LGQSHDQRVILYILHRLEVQIQNAAQIRFQELLNSLVSNYSRKC